MSACRFEIGVAGGACARERSRGTPRDRRHVRTISSSSPAPPYLRTPRCTSWSLWSSSRAVGLDFRRTGFFGGGHFSLPVTRGSATPGEELPRESRGHASVDLDRPAREARPKGAAPSGRRGRCRRIGVFKLRVPAAFQDRANARFRIEEINGRPSLTALSFARSRTYL